MTITFTMSDFLLMILTLAACVIAFTLTRTLKDIHRAVDQLPKTLESLQGLTSRLQGVSEEAERTLVSVRRFTDEGYTVAGDLSATSAQLRAVVEEGAESVRVLFTPLRASRPASRPTAGFAKKTWKPQWMTTNRPNETYEGGTP